MPNFDLIISKHKNRGLKYPHRKTLDLGREILRAFNSKNFHELIRVLNLVDHNTVKDRDRSRVSRIMILLTRDYRMRTPSGVVHLLDDTTAQAVAKALMRIHTEDELLDYMEDKSFRSMGFRNLHTVLKWIRKLKRHKSGALN